MSEKLNKLINKISSGPWSSGAVNSARFEIVSGPNCEKTIAFVFNEYDADFIEACRTEVPKLLEENERLRRLLEGVNGPMNTHKITVPQSVANAISHYVALADSKHEAFTDILSLGYEATLSEIILRHFDHDYDELMEALICGYEVELTHEDWRDSVEK